MTDMTRNSQKSHDPLKPDKEQLYKQLIQVICICKGIRLSKVLEGLKGSNSVEDVNHKTGCGSGGCQGQRCGPKIRALLKKMKSEI